MTLAGSFILHNLQIRFGLRNPFDNRRSSGRSIKLWYQVDVKSVHFFFFTAYQGWNSLPGGEWHVSGHELNALVDASSLATGVVLERFSTVLEDACWLRPKNDAQHINLAELDATLKGLNLALQRQTKVVHLHTDSLCFPLVEQH